MASRTIAQTLRIHGDFIKMIYGAVGDQPFAARRLATLGVDIPPGVCLSRFRNAGIFYPRWQERWSKSHLAALTGRPGICATQEVTA